MDVATLRTKYEELTKLEDTDDGIFAFKDLLLQSDDDDVLAFHLEILKDRTDEYLNRDILSFFSKRKDKQKAGDFLYRTYKKGIEDISVKADVIQLLGHLRNKFAREVALDNITIRKGDLRYRSIIVLGWVGSEGDLETLKDRLLNDPDPQLRGYAATAMRQIWFNYPSTKDTILKYLKVAIEQEKEDKTLEGIIVTAQELLKKKLGLKESSYGDISGDLVVAKGKAIAALEKY